MVEGFYKLACTLWHSVGESFLPVGHVSRDMRIMRVTIAQLLFGALSAPVDNFHSEAAPLIISGFDHKVLECDCRNFRPGIAYGKPR
jgi:hypothetical protein